MKLSVVWIDREQAKVFHVSEEKMERKTFKPGHVEHHAHRRDQLDGEREENRLFKEASAELANSDRILVIGPGVAKHHFHTYLTEHQPLVAKHVRGLETVDHPTDAQIAALAKKHFDRATA